jgi:hypothetical protein
VLNHIQPGIFSLQPGGYAAGVILKSEQQAPFTAERLAKEEKEFKVQSYLWII